MTTTPVPLDLDASAVMRAAGLLRAITTDDGAQWRAVLAQDHNPAGEANPYRTFCGLAVLADRLLDSVATLADEDRETVLARHVDAIVGLIIEHDTDNDPPA